MVMLMWPLTTCSGTSEHCGGWRNGLHFPQSNSKIRSCELIEAKEMVLLCQNFKEHDN